MSAGVPGLEPRLTEPETVGLPITPYPKGSPRWVRADRRCYPTHAGHCTTASTANRGSASFGRAEQHCDRRESITYTSQAVPPAATSRRRRPGRGSHVTAFYARVPAGHGVGAHSGRAGGRAVDGGHLAPTRRGVGIAGHWPAGGRHEDHDPRHASEPDAGGAGRREPGNARPRRVLHDGDRASAAPPGRQRSHPGRKHSRREVRSERHRQVHLRPRAVGVERSADARQRPARLDGGHRRSPPLRRDAGSLSVRSRRRSTLYTEPRSRRRSPSTRPACCTSPCRAPAAPRPSRPTTSTRCPRRCQSNGRERHSPTPSGTTWPR